MPIYGYICGSCDHTFDALQKISDAKLVDCPDCGDASLRKQLSAPKFRLKGQGWYETDFKTGDKRNLASDSDKKTGDKKSDKTEKADTTAKKTTTKTSVDAKAKSA